jgi:hypothetical protein
MSDGLVLTEDTDTSLRGVEKALNATVLGLWVSAENQLLAATSRCPCCRKPSVSLLWWSAPSEAEAYDFHDRVRAEIERRFSAHLARPLAGLGNITKVRHSGGDGPEETWGLAWH